MSGKNILFWTMGLTAAAALVAGCSSSLKEGEVSGAPPQDARQVEMETFGCTCHADLAPVLDQWDLSRHANTNRQPSWGPGYFPQVTCGPCHNGDDRAGDALPVPRLVVDCRQCHQLTSGVGHGTMREATQFLTCTVCHAPSSGAAHTDHHGAESPYSWIGADGSSLGEYGAYAAMTNSQKAAVFYTSHLTIAGESFPQWIVSPGWATGNNGPWHYDGIETINDTHFTEAWLINEDNKLTKYIPGTAQLGYVDLTNTSYNAGMVRKDSPLACTASCHEPHVFDLAINLQWREGAHHPAAKGPLAADSSSAVKPEGGPVNWDAVDDGFSSGCGRCHTANGFAEANEPGFPRFGADGAGNVNISGFGQFLTCNACHDGLGFPSDQVTRLRFRGTIPLYNYAGRTTSIYVVRNAGKSAVCMYCHQAREDNTRIDANIKAFNAATGTVSARYSTVNKRRSKTLQFRNSHYLATAAVLYGKKGYEFAWAATGISFGGYGKASYAGSFFAHIDPTNFGDAGPCAFCHMNDDPAREDLGGHTFLNRNEAGDENRSPCNSAPCHNGTFTFSFENVGPFGDTTNGWLGGDWNGDGVTVSAMQELDSLQASVLAGLLAYQGNQGSVILSEHTEGYPYFTVHYKNAYDTTLAKATFNWQFIHKAEGAWAHNWKYAVELLRDAWRSVTGLNGALGPIPPGDDPRGQVAETPAP